VLYRHTDKAYPLTPGDALFFDAAALHGPEELTKLPMTTLRSSSIRAAESILSLT
jgi:hypothetical protein